MPRKSLPKIVTAAALVQTAYAVMMAVLAWFSIAMEFGRTRPTAQGKPPGLVAGAIVLGVLAVSYGVGAFGLWRARLWAWWWSLLAYLATLAAILWNIFIDKDRDPDNWVAVWILVVPILFLLAARRFIRRRSTAEIAPE